MALKESGLGALEASERLCFESNMIPNVTPTVVGAHNTHAAHTSENYFGRLFSASNPC
jgi:hypothetical protein